MPFGSFFRFHIVLSIARNYLWPIFAKISGKRLGVTQQRAALCRHSHFQVCAVTTKALIVSKQADSPDQKKQSSFK